MKSLFAGSKTVKGARQQRKRTGKKGKREIGDELDMYIGTANITGAGSIVRLEQCLSKADVWCVQETKLRTEEEIAGWQVKLGYLGYKAEVAPCLEGVPGQRKTRSSGVAFLWKPGVDIIMKPEVLLEARVQVMAIRHPALGCVYLYNVYGPQGGTRGSAEMYQVIARHVEKHGKPFVVAGDHNNDKDRIEKLWEAAQGRRELLVFEPESTTCRTPKGESKIDLFMIDTLLAQTVGKIEVLEGHALRTHLPVVVQLKAAAVLEKVRVFKQVKSGTPDRLVGPQEALPNNLWTDFKALTDAVRQQTTISQDQVDQLAEEWETLAQCEAEPLFGRAKKAGGEFEFKEMTLQEALCTKVTDRAVPSFALEHFIRRAKEYRTLVTDGQWGRISRMWKSWKDHKTAEFYEKHTKGNEAVEASFKRVW